MTLFIFPLFLFDILQSTSLEMILQSIQAGVKEFVHFVADQRGFFVEVNSSLDISCTTLWESLKVNLRGQIISYTSYHKKQANQNCQT